MSISALRAEMADRHRRGLPVGQHHRDDLFLFPYFMMEHDFTEDDYALFEQEERWVEDVTVGPDDWQGS